MINSGFIQMDGKISDTAVIPTGAREDERAERRNLFNEQ